MTAQLPLDLSPPEPPKAPRAAALRSYHVRSHQTAEEAQAGERRAATQDEQILAHFRACSRPYRRWTPSELAFFWPAWPITSIRRSLTNLTARGLLVHHAADRRPGPHGARESTWGLP